MRSPTTSQSLVRGAIAALLVIVAVGLLTGPAGLRPERTAQAALLSEVRKLAASDSEAQDWFGISVSVSGEIAIVGARREDAGGTDAGAAYIFERDLGGPGNWGQVRKLTASDAEAGDYFGFSVAVDDDTAVVGAYEDGTSAIDDGNAYVFQRDQGGADNWGEVKKLAASDAQLDDAFGWSVAVSDDIVLVGSPFEDSQGDNAGATYIFRRDEGGAGNWGEVIKLIASDGQASANYFGWSVAVSGGTAVVGTSGFAGAYVFQQDEGGTDNWGEVTKLAPSEPHEGAVFGLSVAVSGAAAAVGAPYDGDGGSTGGAAFVFHRDSGGADNWGEAKKLVAADEGASFLGWSISISGETAVVGDFIDSPGILPEAAFVFQLPAPKDADADTDGDTIANSEDLDDDGDGCSDLQENGKDPTVGGLRNPHNPWDFYDVLGEGGGPPDQLIDLPNDILGVILRFAPQGQPPYDVQFDRGPSSGPNAWNMTAPDGVIDLPNDVLGVILQFNHSCQ